MSPLPNESTTSKLPILGVALCSILFLILFNISYISPNASAIFFTNGGKYTNSEAFLSAWGYTYAYSFLSLFQMLIFAWILLKFSKICYDYVIENFYHENLFERIFRKLNVVSPAVTSIFVPLIRLYLKIESMDTLNSAIFKTRDMISHLINSNSQTLQNDLERMITKKMDEQLPINNPCKTTCEVKNETHTNTEPKEIIGIAAIRIEKLEESEESYWLNNFIRGTIQISNFPEEIKSEIERELINSIKSISRLYELVDKDFLNKNPGCLKLLCRPIINALCTMVAQNNSEDVALLKPYMDNFYKTLSEGGPIVVPTSPKIRGIYIQPVLPFLVQFMKTIK